VLARSEDRPHRVKDLVVYFGGPACCSCRGSEGLHRAGQPRLPIPLPIFPGDQHRWTAETAAHYFKVLTDYGTWGLGRTTCHFALRLLTNDPRFGGGMDALGRLAGADFASLPLAVWALSANRFWRGLLVLGGYLSVWFCTGSCCAS